MDNPVPNKEQEHPQGKEGNSGGGLNPPPTPPVERERVDSMKIQLTHNANIPHPNKNHPRNGLRELKTMRF